MEFTSTLQRAGYVLYRALVTTLFSLELFVRRPLPTIGVGKGRRTQLESVSTLILGMMFFRFNSTLSVVTVAVVSMFFWRRRMIPSPFSLCSSRSSSVTRSHFLCSTESRSVKCYIYFNRVEILYPGVLSMVYEAFKIVLLGVADAGV